MGNPCHKKLTKFLTGMIVLFLIFEGCSYASIQISSVNYLTKCAESLLSGIDELELKATVDITQIYPELPPFQIQVYLHSADGSLVTICRETLPNCIGGSCSCSTVTTGAVYQLVVNLIATKWFSNQSLSIALLDRTARTSAVSSKVYLPTVYDINSESVHVQVNDAAVNLSSRPCNIYLTRCHNTIEHCCFHSPTPCMAHISYAGLDAAKFTCVKVRLPHSSVGTYVFYRSVCHTEISGPLTCRAYNRLPVGNQTLTINHKRTDITSLRGVCEISLPRRKNLVQYCCSPVRGVCEASIALPANRTFKKGNRCVAAVIDGPVTGEIYFSYAICGDKSTVSLVCHSNKSSVIKDTKTWIVTAAFLFGILLLGVPTCWWLHHQMKRKYKCAPPRLDLKPKKSAMIKANVPRTPRPPRKVTFRLSLTSYRSQ